jgi:Na+-transporting NADH:ubiquinone oxidoreductase subunit B
VFQKQPLMRKLLFSLIPIFAFSFYLYGLRLLWLGFFVFSCGIFAEYFYEKKRKKKVSEAVLVTCSLFLLSLPPLTPWWVASIGIVFGVIMAKEVYGGFGKNIFNPAIAGRLFVYISFPGIMTGSIMNYGSFGSDISLITSATPLDAIRNGVNPDLFSLLFGLRTGAMGESMSFLIILSALYLIISKTANFRLILSTLLSAAVMIVFFDLLNLSRSIDTPAAMLSGSLLFVSVFMVTDPVSAPKNIKAQWLYGIIVGTTTILIRTFSLFSEGTSFGVLIGNTFASLLDEFLSKKKAVS